MRDTILAVNQVAINLIFSNERKENSMNFTTFMEKLFEEELSKFTKLQPKGKDGIFYYMEEAKDLQKKFEKDRFFVVRNPKLAASCLIQFRVRIAGFKKYGIENGFFDTNDDSKDLESRLIWLKEEQEEEAQRYYIWDFLYLENKGAIREYLALLAFESPKEEEREKILFYQVCETDDGTKEYYKPVNEGTYEILLEKFYLKGDNYDMFVEDNDDEEHDYLWRNDSETEPEETDFEEKTEAVGEAEDVFDDEEDDKESDEEEFEYETVSYGEDDEETKKLTTISMKNKETGEDEIFYFLGYFRTKPVEGGNEDHDYIAVTPNHPYEENNIEVAFFEVRNMYGSGNEVEFIGVSEEQMKVLFQAFKESCEAQEDAEEDDFENEKWENDDEDEK